MINIMLLAAAALLGPSGAAVISDDELRTQIAAMKADVRPDTVLLARPVLKAGGTTAALELWRKPLPPAIHVAEAEYVTVVEGSGWMLSGGTMSNAKETHPGLLSGDAIQGGTSRALKRGDTILIPAGMPHWFGIHGKALVLLGVKIPALPPKP